MQIDRMVQSPSSRKKLVLALLALLFIVSLWFVWRGLDVGVSDQAPPRSTGEFVGEVGESTISLPVGADLTGLSRNLESEIPIQLWSIDKAEQTCVPPKTVDILIVKLKTPTIKCRIEGEVTRGSISLTGSGRDILATVPVSASLRAKDIGGILKQETAQARAVVRVKLRLDISPQWRTGGKVDVSYEWTDSPHVDFLGQRIDLTEAADAKLPAVTARLEKLLVRELARLPLREEAQAAWDSAFTSLSLNEANPPVWMRVTPLKVQYSGYAIENGRLNLHLGLTAKTETFVGSRPPDPDRTPLPRLMKTDNPANRFRLNIPVIAEYGTLEPVLARALRKRERRPFDLPAVGPVVAHFQKVTLYGTEDDKIAVGLKFTARTASAKRSSGTVWLTAKPVSKPNSVKVNFEDLRVTGVTDSIGGDLLIELANTPSLSQLVSEELAQNFAKDVRSLRFKIDAELARKQEGNLTITARITNIQTGRLKATPVGLYLPVKARGTARLHVRQ